MLKNKVRRCRGERVWASWVIKLEKFENFAAEQKRDAFCPSGYSRELGKMRTAKPVLSKPLTIQGSLIKCRKCVRIGGCQTKSH
jgi:hypothetical protein